MQRTLGMWSHPMSAAKKVPSEKQRIPRCMSLIRSLAPEEAEESGGCGPTPGVPSKKCPAKSSASCAALVYCANERLRKQRSLWGMVPPQECSQGSAQRKAACPRQTSFC
ncbi:hypothetical protein NDU88_002950 [Pleurodeles waltl]|uniref:Uncharacterized protein n=1 Tax=Pleurodeles waltl TaxID=8319 RepID=A0AAV7VG39_PLEWA|nr:hypothetical protein NDU88_002950 [Pleurodeles waltl]